LSPGETIVLPGTTLADRPELAGTVITDGFRPFTIQLNLGLTVTGIFQEQVVREDVTGTLDFYFRIVDVRGAGLVSSVQRQDFAGFSTDVDSLSTGESPATAARSGDGSQILFNFVGDQTPFGIDQSHLLFIKSNATAFDEAGQAVIFGGNDIVQIGEGSARVPTFQPVAVPEPGALRLMGVAVLSLGGLARIMRGFPGHLRAPLPLADERRRRDDGQEAARQNPAASACARSVHDPWAQRR
jgi:hypothetical protein